MTPQSQSIHRRRHLVQLHRSIPQVALERSIPRLVSIFDNVEPIAVREEWQRAIASLSLVLAVAARENAVVTAVEP